MSTVSGTDPDHEAAICKHCRRPIWRRVNPEPGEWAHYPGSRYCQTSRGLTATPLKLAEPMSHPKEGFDEGDYAIMGREPARHWSCNRCATVTTDRGIHDKHCPGKKEIR